MADNKQHLTKEQLTAFHNNQLGANEYLPVLEHIGSCTHCAALFASSFEQEKLLNAPSGLKDSILAKTNKKSFPVISFPWKSAQKRQLFFYSLKVCAAMCGALVIMISSMQLNLDGTESALKKPATQHSTMDFLNNLTTSMREFSDGVSQNITSIVSIYDNDNYDNKENSTIKTEVIQ